MRYFPIFLDLSGRAVVVVGGGEEALRKLRLLARTAARIQVVAADVDPEIAALPGISQIDAPFSPELLDGAVLVVSTDPVLNRTVAKAAARRGIPCNCVDRPGLSSFIMPSIVDRTPVVVAIGTEGTAPVLGQGLRSRIEAMLPPRLGAIAAMAAQLRERIARELPPGRARREFWRHYFFGPAGQAILADQRERHGRIVENLIAGQRDAGGSVAFVSAGSGDPDLLTLKAHRLLQEADAIAHDRDMPAAILEFARRDATRLLVGPTDFTTTANLLMSEVQKGHRVVRLHMGCVSVEERAAVAAEAIAVEVVPGVPAPRGRVLPPFRQRPREALEPMKAAS